MPTCSKVDLVALDDLALLLADSNTQLADILASQGAQKLRRWLTQAGLGVTEQGVTFGLCPGSGNLSVSFSFSHDQHIDEGTNVAAAMLGLQTQVDATRFGSGEKVFANVCLEKFMQCTGLGVTRIVNQRDRVRFWLALRQDILSKSTTVNLFQFSKSYVFQDREKLATQMLNSFWREFDAEGYVLSDNLLKKASGLIRNFFLSGSKAGSEVFSPRFNKGVKLYLEGKAGVGKSSFTRCFTACLEKTLQKFVCDKSRVDLVKIPLNYMSASHLKSILTVTGISDFSIERKIEQTLVRQNIAVLHLEENPKDLIQQKQMFTMIQKMVNNLCAKYPDSTAKVIFVVTANYPPSKVFSEFCHVNVQAPTYMEQKQLILRSICDSVIKHSNKLASISALPEITGEQLEVNFEPSVFPPFCSDMRILTKFSLSVSFSCFKLLLSWLKSTPNMSESFRLSLHVSKTSGGGLEIELVPFEAFYPFLGKTMSKSRESLLGLDEQKFGSTTSFSSVEFKSDTDSVAPKYVSKIKQNQGFFVTDKGVYEDINVFDMTLHGFLTPGVILIEPSESHASIAEMNNSIAQVLANLGLWSSQSSVHYICHKLELKTDEDKMKVVGSPKDIRGGLTKTIDDSNNPNSTASTHDCALCNNKVCNDKNRLIVFVVSVSSTGQFMLRELLESSKTSQSHRLNVSKERVVFVLSPSIASDGSFDAFSPQILSRSSCRMTC